MKLAKVVDVQDARAPKTCDPWLTDPAQRARAEELLRLYPHTTEDESTEIQIFLTKGRHYDVGMVAGNDEFRDKVMAFREANKKHFRLRPVELVGSIMLACILVIAAWYFAF